MCVNMSISVTVNVCQYDCFVHISVHVSVSELMCHCNGMCQCGYEYQHA